MFRRLSESLAIPQRALIVLILGMCLPVFGFNRIPLHDMLHALMHYNFIARDWVVSDALLGLWNPYREYGMNLFVEHIFNFHPLQYLTLIFAKFFSDQNTITAIKLVYVCINAIFAIGLYKLLFKITNCKVAAIFAAITAGFYFPWFASPSFNLVTVWLLPLCYYTVILFLETHRIKWILLSLLFLTFSCFQGNGYLGMNVMLAYVVVVIGYLYKAKNLEFSRKKLFDSPFTIALITLVGLGLFTSLYFMYLEFTEQFFLTTQRSSSDGRTGLRMFLTFATPANLFHFGGFWHGVSTSRDGIAYAGFLLPALSVYGLLYSTDFRTYVPYLASLLVVLGLALGAVSFVALIVFHFPGFSLYRHLGLLLPIAKFHLVIIAAMGLSVFMADLRRETNNEISRRSLYIIVPLLLIAAFCTILSLVFGAKVGSGDFYGHSRYALVACLYVALLVGFKRLSIGSSSGKKVGVLILVITFVDGISFYSQQAFEYTVELSDESYDAFRVSTDFTYEEERYVDAYEDADFARLMKDLEKNPVFRAMTATYDSTYGATDTEPCYSAFRRFSSSIYLKPLYEALQAIDGRTYPMAGFEKKIEQVVSKQSDESIFPDLLYSINDTNVIAFNGVIYAVPQGIGVISLEMWRSGMVSSLPGVKTTVNPARQPVLLKQSVGCESPKIRLVDQCRVSVSDDRQSVSHLLDITRSDDSPFSLYIAEQHQVPLQNDSCGFDQPPSQPRVTSFSPHEISVTLDSLESGKWLYLGYSWNSRTRVDVDGEARPIYRTNLGFMSTPLKAGDRNVVIFRTKPKLWPRLVLILSNLLVCLAILIVLFKKNAPFPESDKNLIL
jgi:hypothetical protein